MEELLRQTNYPPDEINFLIDGFTNGFALGFNGDRRVIRTAPNLRLDPIGTPLDLWNKVISEVKSHRFAGPFLQPPFQHYIQSPLGLVPKDGGTKTRLIFHLSYPRRSRSGKPESVNANIPRELTTVQYPQFDEAVQLCLDQGPGCKAAKSDMTSAFRHLPIRREDWALLVMFALHPLTGLTYYFFDKCVPFRAATSCALFQRFFQCGSSHCPS